MSNPNGPDSWPDRSPVWSTPGTGPGTPPPTPDAARSAGSDALVGATWAPPVNPGSPGGPPFTPPPAKPRDAESGRRVGVGVGLAVAVVVALIAAVAGVTVVDQPPHPTAWDPRVADLARFVQDERGMLFVDAVAVDFLTEDEFRQEVTTDEATLTDEDRASIEDSTAELRALGLVGTDFDLFGEANEITGDSTLAYYDPRTERIAVRGTELTPYVRGTIVHEMTHALQDQHFDLQELQNMAGPDGDFRFRSVVEGDAVNVAAAYYDELSTEDQVLFDEEHAASFPDDGAGGGAEEAGGPDYSSVVAALFSAPYTIGPPFTSLLDSVDGDAGVNDALTVLPKSDAAVLDASLYFDEVEPVDIELPEVPEGAETLNGGQFGALGWFVVLSSRLDAHDALEFVDAWRGDSYVTYRQTGRICMAARYQAEIGALDDAQRMLEEWAASMPAGSATVTPSPEYVALTSCDPGADADTAAINDVSEAMIFPAVRLMIADQAVGEGATFEQAWCYSDAVIDRLSLSQLQSDELTAELESAILEAGASCR